MVALVAKRTAVGPRWKSPDTVDADDEQRHAIAALAVMISRGGGNMRLAYVTGDRNGMNVGGG